MSLRSYGHALEQKRDPAGFKVRTITAADAHFLGAMPPGAAAGPPERPRVSLEEVLADPQTARYVEDWARAGDTGRIAECPEGTALGPAW